MRARSFISGSLCLISAFVAVSVLTHPATALEFSGVDLISNNGASASSEGYSAPSDPALAMARYSSATDPLSNFGPSSGTVVGNRARQLREEILRLRSNVNLNANEFSVLRASGTAGAVQYHSTVAAITARLQNGTTRSNPILLRQWEEAENSLNQVTQSLNRLNSLQTAIDADASLASYMLESIQAAFQLAGAMDEDHDQLKLLRDEVSRVVVQLDYLRNQTSQDIERQSNYLTTERSNIQALAFSISKGELIGNSLANHPVLVNPSPVVSLPASQPPMASPVSYSPSMSENGMAPAPQAAPAMPVDGGGIATSNPNVGIAPVIGKLLVLIRYNQPDIKYEQQLTQAVGKVLERHPNAEFSVVAVTPTSGDAAETAKSQQEAGSNADAVKRSLVQMGLSPSRIATTNAQAESAQTPEVHVYVR